MLRLKKFDSDLPVYVDADSISLIFQDHLGITNIVLKNTDLTIPIVESVELTRELVEKARTK